MEIRPMKYALLLSNFDELLLRHSWDEMGLSLCNVLMWSMYYATMRILLYMN